MTQEPPMMAGDKAPMSNEEGGEPTKDESGETSSVFFRKDELGGRECKPGEKLTFTVKDVDPDTGEVEAEIEGYDKGAQSSSGSTSDAIDGMGE